MIIKYTKKYESKQQTQDFESIICDQLGECGNVEAAGKMAYLSVKTVRSLIEVLWERGVIFDSDIKRILENVGCPIDNNKKFKVN